MTSRHCATLTGLLTAAFLSMPTASQAIVFGSDVHVGDSSRNLTNLETLLNQVWDSSLALVGDQVRHGGTERDRVGDYQKLEEVVGRATSDWSTENGVARLYSKGNHDLGYENPDIYPPTYNFDYESGIVPNVDLIAISPENYNSAWFLDYLNWWLWAQCEYGQNGNLGVIMSHYPLHAVRDGIDPAATAAIFDLVNEWTNPERCSDPLDVIFVWGHTHSDIYDDGIRMIAKPGETMLSPGATRNSKQHENANEVLNFLYLNAGYVSTADGGHITQLIPLGDYYYYVSRIGQGGWEEGVFVER